jgi:cystathionine beta-lyase/cystathionine gamma-synthase
MAGYSPDTVLGKSTPLAPPLYQSSVYTLPDLDALDAILDAGEPGFTYARDAHPNAAGLATRLAEAEGAKWAVLCGSGMAAISALMLSLVKKGDRILASNQLYGRTTRLLSEEFHRFGVETSYVDTNDLSEVKNALSAGPRVLLVETISNPLLRVADLPTLTKLAHDSGCAVVIDNTFATPILCRPLDRGADFVMESLTKMIGGHSDLTLGVVCGNSDLLPRITTVISTWGMAASPFDCWLTSRSMATLSLRMRAASATAATVADWLATQRGITRVIYPGRSDHPDYATANSILSDGFGNMLCFELAGGRESANRFFRLASGIPFSPSLGDATTTCSHPFSTSHRYVREDEKSRAGITEGLIRLSIGIEPAASITAELAKGLPT